MHHIFTFYFECIGKWLEKWQAQLPTPFFPHQFLFTAKIPSELLGIARVKRPLLERVFQCGELNREDFGERTGQEWQDNSHRVRTDEKNSGDSVRLLGTITQTIFVPNQEPAFAWPFGIGMVRVGTKGLFRPCLNTFFERFLPTRLTAPSFPRISRQEQSCAYLRFFRGLASALFFILSRESEKLVPFSGGSPLPKVLATTNKRLSWESWPCL